MDNFIVIVHILTQNHVDSKSAPNVANSLHHLLQNVYVAHQKLWVHLENEQHIHFVVGDEDLAVEKGQETELTAFFKFNAYLFGYATKLQVTEWHIRISAHIHSTSCRFEVCSKCG